MGEPTIYAGRKVLERIQRASNFPPSNAMDLLFSSVRVLKREPATLSNQLSRTALNNIRYLAVPLAVVIYGLTNRHRSSPIFLLTRRSYISLLHYVLTKYISHLFKIFSIETYFIIQGFLHI